MRTLASLGDSHEKGTKTGGQQNTHEVDIMNFPRPKFYPNHLLCLRHEGVTITLRFLPKTRIRIRLRLLAYIRVGASWRLCCRVGQGGKSKEW